MVARARNEFGAMMELNSKVRGGDGDEASVWRVVKVKAYRIELERHGSATAEAIVSSGSGEA